METTTPDTLIPDDFDLEAAWKKEDLADRVRVNIRTIERMVKDGRVPRPMKIGNLVRWNAAEIRVWFESGCPRREPLWTRLRGCNECMNARELCRGCREFEALDAAKTEVMSEETEL